MTGMLEAPVTPRMVALTGTSRQRRRVKPRCSSTCRMSRREAPSAEPASRERKKVATAIWEPSKGVPESSVQSRLK